MNILCAFVDALHLSRFKVIVKKANLAAAQEVHTEVPLKNHDQVSSKLELAMAARHNLAC